MIRSTLFWVILIILTAFAAAAVALRYGVPAQRTEDNRSLASAQAMLAFGHYKFYERLESMLVQKCYEAALTETRELKKLQLALVSRNLRASDNEPGLVEYIKIRDPVVLESILAGRVPEPQSYTTTCP